MKRYFNFKKVMKDLYKTTLLDKTTGRVILL